MNQLFAGKGSGMNLAGGPPMPMRGQVDPGLAALMQPKVPRPRAGRKGMKKLSNKASSIKMGAGGLLGGL